MLRLLLSRFIEPVLRHEPVPQDCCQLLGIRRIRALGFSGSGDQLAFCVGSGRDVVLACGTGGATFPQSRFEVNSPSRTRCLLRTFAARLHIPLKAFVEIVLIGHLGSTRDEGCPQLLYRDRDRGLQIAPTPLPLHTTLDRGGARAVCGTPFSQPRFEVDSPSRTRCLLRTFAARLHIPLKTFVEIVLIGHLRSTRREGCPQPLRRDRDRGLQIAPTPLPLHTTLDRGGARAVCGTPFSQPRFEVDSPSRTRCLLRTFAARLHIPLKTFVEIVLIGHLRSTRREGCPQPLRRDRDRGLEIVPTPLPLRCTLSVECRGVVRIGELSKLGRDQRKVQRVETGHRPLSSTCGLRDGFLFEQ